MPSIQSRITQIFIRLRLKKRLPHNSAYVVKFARARYGNEHIAQRFTPKEVNIQTVNETNFKGEWVWWEGQNTDRVILYFHGGAYISCSPATHRPCTAELSRQASVRVFALDYRLAPEHQFPAQIEDALAAYRWLLQQGIAPQNIVIGGDSAGGNLTLVTLLALREAKEPLPAFAFCFSPWTDMTASGESYKTNNKRDPLFYGDGPHIFAELYLGAHEPTNPLASPAFADFTGLPPLSIYVGSTEVLLDDARKVIANAQACGITADLHIADRQPHVWPIMVGFMPEAKQTLKEVASKIQQHLFRGKEKER